jgi:hypothetical protein
MKQAKPRTGSIIAPGILPRIASRFLPPISPLLPPRPVVESLECRTLLTSSSILLQYDFNGATAWPTMSGTVSNGGTAALIQGGVGTVDTEGGVTPSGGLRLTATPPASGPWVSDLNSGPLAVTNTETNLGKLTLSFNLSASQALPVKVIVYSYSSATGSPTGALATIIYPAAAYYNQRFAVDLSTMNPYGPGTFNPAAAYVSFSFEMSTQYGWSPASADQLRLDNVNYSKPAYYVNAATGNNSYNGLTEATAFATPEKAVSISQPGDIILVMSGTYTITSAGTNAIHFSAGGTPADWVVLKNYPGQSPLITSEFWNAVLIGNGSSTNIATTAAVAYVEVRGLHIQGDGAYANTTYASLLNQPQPQTNGNGLTVDGRFETNHPHDIRFANNLVEYCSGAGIAMQDGDRIQIENNISRNNCWWSIYAPSGISVFSAYSFDGLSGTYTRLVRGNTTYGNQCFEMWASQGKYSDGNGIIIDYNHNTTYLPNSVVVNRTLVTDNVSYNNGGSGIHSFESDHVDIFNNVAYLNSASVHLQYGEIFGGSDSDVRIYDNILVAPVANTSGGALAEPVNSGPSSFFQNNLYFGGNTAPVMGTGDRILDPKFVNPSIDPTVADFRLLSNSPAINAGLAAFAPSVDFLNNVRNGVPDIGAYEYYASVPTVVTSAAAFPSPISNNSTGLTVLAGDNDGPLPLTYTWSVTAKPAGAADPVFAAQNGTYVANTTTATFNRAGSYTLAVTITDANSNSTTSSVTVVVNQTTTAISLTPTPLTLAGGTVQQFTAAVTDQFGQPMSPVLTWSTTGGGTINSTGLFTANQSGGAFSITATNSGISGTATLNVVPTIYAVSSAGYYVRLAPDGTTEQIWVGTPGNVGPANTSTPTYSIPLTALPSLSFGPASGNEALTVDLANGKPLPAGAFNFNGSTGTDSLSILGSSGNDSVTVNATQILFGTSPITYSNIESISANLGTGTDTLTQAAQPANNATLTFQSPTTSDTLIVSGGTFTFPASTSGITQLSLANLSVSAGASVVLANASPHTTRTLLALNAISLPTTATLDLAGNDLIVHTTSPAAAAATASALNTDAIAAASSGIGLKTSVSADGDSNAKIVGIALAFSGQSFDNLTANTSDVLLKTTYYGDTNDDGKVDATDYSRIDVGFLTHLTGWSNGDLNYDGLVDGSDYTLIDNAYNSQAAPLAATVAASPQTSLAKPTGQTTIASPQTTTTDTDKTKRKSIVTDLEQVTL